jgi:hypothetical protein
MLNVVEELIAWGHPNITATHRTTLEITREPTLTRRGDCIVAVKATKGLKDLSQRFRTACQNDSAIILVELRTDNTTEYVSGKGNRLLTLDNSREFVIRKSSYVTDRTLMINSNKAAIGLNRNLIRKLKLTTTKLYVRLTVEV